MHGISVDRLEKYAIDERGKCMNRFQGKRILVTGATSGIGLTGAKRIAAEGGEIIATGRDLDRLEALKRELPMNAKVVHNDANSTDCGQQLAQRVATLGKLDGVWFNAGSAIVGQLENIDAAAFDAVIHTNLRGPVLQMAALSSYLAEGASVVVSGSTSAYEGAAMASLYAAAKGALLSLTRCWASALGARDIRVNTLVPGPIHTPFRDFMPPDFRQRFEEDVSVRLALTRMGSADEAAAVALFLLSDESSFVTGSQYAVDGGLVMQ